MGGWATVSHLLFFQRTLIHAWSSVPYAALAKTFSLIESTTKRLEKTSYLTSFLLLVIQRSAKGDYKSLLQTVYLCINRVCRLPLKSPIYANIQKVVTRL